jgi:hypothetical protein
MDDQLIALLYHRPVALALDRQQRLADFWTGTAPQEKPNLFANVERTTKTVETGSA